MVTKDKQVPKSATLTFFIYFFFCLFVCLCVCVCVCFLCVFFLLFFWGGGLFSYLYLRHLIIHLVTYLRSNFFMAVYLSIISVKHLNGAKN